MKKKPLREREIYISEHEGGYRTLTENYLLIDGKMYLAKNKKQLLKSLPDDWAKKAAGFIGKQKLKMKSIEDVLNLAEFLEPTEAGE